MNKIITVIIVVVIAVAGLYLYSRYNSSDTAYTTVSPSAYSTPTESPSASPSASLSPTAFTSQALGISFMYSKTQPGTTAQFTATLSGTKVYVHDASKTMTSGQSVEVFTKTASEALETAVKKHVTIPTGCIVKSTSDLRSDYPATYQVVVIEPISPNVASPVVCPRSNLGGLAYFVMDSKHPKQFAFLSIGQYAIMADVNIPWQNTVKFLK